MNVLSPYYKGSPADNATLVVGFGGLARRELVQSLVGMSIHDGVTVTVVVLGIAGSWRPRHSCRRGSGGQGGASTLSGGCRAMGKALGSTGGPRDAMVFSNVLPSGCLDPRHGVGPQHGLVLKPDTKLYLLGSGLGHAGRAAEPHFGERRQLRVLGSSTDRSSAARPLYYNRKAEWTPYTFLRPPFTQGW